MTSLGNELESERQRLQEQERRSRQNDCENRASTINWMDEKQRLLSTIQSLETQISSLEELREKERNTNKPHRSLYRGIGQGTGGGTGR